ncbi:MAG: NAD-dependent epimerase/dehydratase family protein [Candidatus Bipolaricaulaceae bacterium]
MRCLVTGATGQIGSELTLALRAGHGEQNVVAAGHRTEPRPALRDSGPFVYLDVTAGDDLRRVVEEWRVDTIFHLAAVLSAKGEQAPDLAWQVNMVGLRNVLQLAREHNLRVFWPSSIAVFGPRTPRTSTPQDTVLCPTTMYGVTKAAGEFLCEYYATACGVDVRGVRYPGIISAETPPGGGTTDYAVEMFYAAVRGEPYTCFVGPDTVLPMMYMPDALRAACQLMDADPNALQHHADFNVTAMSFSAAELAAEIKRHLPGFRCRYQPDFRQDIADSWPRTIDDSAARREWGWRPQYDLATMTADMLRRLGERHARGEL